jgi:hypothetical protein
MKMLKRILVALFIILVILQAFRPDKNNVSANTANSIVKNYAVPDSVKVILAKACNDCHSNKTQYPWYTNVQPVGWWIDDHIEDGKHHLNFDEFSNYRIAKQYKKLEECMDEVKEGGMPIGSYTLIHKEAVLTEAEKQTLYHWCTNIRDSIKAKYPADSLVIKRKK